MNYIVLPLLLFTLSSSLYADEIGSVDTVFKFFGSNHKIIVEAFDDPKVSGVTCHLSRAKTGGISGSLGVAEDKAEASIACRQIGPIKLPPNLQNGESVFSKKTSLVFKSIQVVRFHDKKRNVLIYLVYSDRLIEGSPKNSISTVPILKWEQ
jgi:CreA protein